MTPKERALLKSYQDEKINQGHVSNPLDLTLKWKYLIFYHLNILDHQNYKKPTVRSLKFFLKW